MITRAINLNPATRVSGLAVVFNPKIARGSNLSIELTESFWECNRNAKENWFATNQFLKVYSNGAFVLKVKS
jgi:hypothetical protein